MKCPRCQHENPTGSNFCLGCGARFGISCSSCSNELPPGSRFCNKCGTPVALESTGQSRFSSPETYTPKHLAEKILTSKAALEGERKQVTVLFADLKGSMELLADRDPEEARKLLDPVLEHMMEAVHRFEGTVNQVMGDGIMALFGAPLAHEDHAVRACYAALRMQETVKKYAEGVRREYGVTIRIRVGLNSGEVVVRAIGSDLHMDYTAVGQTTHLAARMEQLTEPGSILLSPATMELAEGYVDVKPLGPLPVKGLPTPVEVYELVGAGAVRSRLHAAAARGLSRFVGRDGEVDQLRQALERAQAGHGQVVAVVGEPGVGKSRLYWEFIHSHRVHGWLLLESGSVSYDKATAYLPVMDLLKAYFHIEGRDDTRTIREKVTGKVLSLDRALEPSLSALLSLLEVPVEDDAWGRLDPPQRRQRTLDAVKRLLLRVSQVQPLMLLVEDLHWIDAETQALLDSLVESLPTARLLLLTNYRPEYQHRWGSKTYYQQLRIDPLPAESADDLLTSLLGSDNRLDSLKRTLIERTEGNPLFLEESVRTLAETKVLIGERGTYRLAQGATAIQVPPTVQAILAARIDRLAPEDKRLLQAAAVIGTDVPFALLLKVAELGEEDLQRGLAHLQAAEFLYQARRFPDLEYTFRHALTHEVTYGGLLQERRRALHARIVDAMETLHPDVLGEQVDRLAYHAIQGEAWNRAVRYLCQAGRKAIVKSAYHHGVASFEQALELLTRLPESRETLEQAIDLRLDLRALVHTGQYKRILDYMCEAEALARELGDRSRLAAVLADLSARFRNVGDHDRAIETARQALATAAELGDLDREEEATYRAGQAYFAVGNFVEAMDLLRQSVDVEGRRGRVLSGLPRFFRAWSLGWLALTCATVGRFADGIRCGTEAVHIAESADHSFSLVEARSALGGVHLGRGELDAAIALFEPALTLTRTLGITLPNVLSGLGHAYALAGRLAEALALLESAIEQRTAISAMAVGQAVHVNRLAEAYLAVGRAEQAVEGARLALDLARNYKEPANEAFALRLLGEIASHRDPANVEAAQSHYREALALAEPRGMRPLVAHCHLGLGKLYRRTGKRDEAQEHLATATTMYREMGMHFWLEQAEQESRQIP
jgi:class 3 adenylate cyclase/tetratricopeptide (TPR) repeat protein